MTEKQVQKEIRNLEALQLELNALLNEKETQRNELLGKQLRKQLTSLDIAFDKQAHPIQEKIDDSVNAIKTAVMKHQKSIKALDTIAVYTGESHYYDTTRVDFLMDLKPDYADDLIKCRKTKNPSVSIR